MKMRVVLAAVVMVGIAGGLAMGEGKGADTRAAATGAASQAAGKVTFFGVETRGVGRVAFVLDHSGAMFDSFDFLRQELANSVKGLSPTQKFAVVSFSEAADELFPKDNKWVAAGDEAKRDLEKWISGVKARGENCGMLDCYLSGIKVALEMNPPPDVVYFLTDGPFDRRLAAEVGKRNPGKKVKIQTMMFVGSWKDAEEDLKKMAAENGGTYKFVAVEDLGGK